jgi:hypothetical protein
MNLPQALGGVISYQQPYSTFLFLKLHFKSNSNAKKPLWELWMFIVGLTYSDETF